MNPTLKKILMASVGAMIASAGIVAGPTLANSLPPIVTISPKPVRRVNIEVVVISAVPGVQGKDFAGLLYVESRVYSGVYIFPDDTGFATTPETKTKLTTAAGTSAVATFRYDLYDLPFKGQLIGYQPVSLRINGIEKKAVVTPVEYIENRNGEITVVKELKITGLVDWPTGPQLPPSPSPYRPPSPFPPATMNSPAPTPPIGTPSPTPLLP